VRQSWQFGIVGMVTLAVVCAGGYAQQAGAPAAGKVETYQVDAVHSSIWFRVKHSNVSYFYGRFNEVAGKITLSDDLAACALDMQVKVASIDTNNADRDKHLKSADFFEAETYPLVTFKSRSFKQAGDDAYEVTGDLTLHGVTKPLTVKLEKTGAGPGMKGEYRLGLETTFEIKRTDFGMTKLVGPVSDEVRLIVAVAAVRD